MNRLMLLKLTDIAPDPDQPRRSLDTKRLQDLADNIKARGVIQPITVRPSASQEVAAPYVIVTGERRWAASGLAGKEHIQALIAEDPSTMTPDAVFYHQLSENLHRENLHPLEKAEFLKTRLDMLRAGGCTDPTTTLAHQLGTTHGWVSKSIAILKLGDDIRDIAQQGLVRSYPILKALSQLKGKKRQDTLQSIYEGTFVPASLKSQKRKSRTSPPPASPYHLDPGEITLLIDATPYAAVLDADFPEWRANIPEALARLRPLLASST